MKSLYLSLIVLALSIPSIAQSNKRIALVIGAQHYTGLPVLRNSLNDAKAMAATLQSKGFQVDALYDPKTKREIKDAINRYFNLMRDESGAVGVIFYAGHGMQYEGENYIIPTTATVANPGDLDDNCVRMNTVMAVLKSASNSLNILLLDACRSLPSFTRGSEQGLTRMDAPQGAIIVFATQPGSVASDGSSGNGLFTSKLLSVINEDNLNITDVFKKVKQEVFAESNKMQLPSVEDNSIGGDFYFSGKDKNSAPVPQVVASLKPIQSSSTSFDYGYGANDAPTVSVGSQVLLVKNLNVDHFANGDVIPEVQNAEEWKRAGAEKKAAWCYYNNDPANGSTYGKLYNWYAVHDSRGLAPKGWHVLSDKEWAALTTYLGGATVAGTKMKSVEKWESNGNSDNSSGITGLPGGTRFINGSFYSIGKFGTWWSSSETPTPEKAWVHYLDGSNGTAFRTNRDMAFGFSVRCVKD